MSNDSASSPASKPFARTFLLLLIAAAAFIRVYNANSFYYSADEAMHTGIAGASSLGEVLAFSRFEIHPPLLYILCHYWMMISSDPAFVRGLPLLFGLLTIPLYYGIGRLLGDELTGLACAGLIAFSHGCIIQSYVVRQYMIFVFFISLAFYCYLRWRTQRSQTTLIGYGLFAALACLTHFSAIFDVACIAGFETARMLRRKAPGATLGSWMLVNAITGLAALYVYDLWQPILAPLKSYFAVYDIPSPKLLISALKYPLAACNYILPGQSDVVSCLILSGLAVCLLRKCGISRAITLRALIILAMIAFAFGLALMLTGIYAQLGTRRSLWLLPFLIPPAGWMIALSLRRALSRILPASGSFHLQIGALMIFTAGCLLYHQQQRYDDGSEYVWQKEVWDSFSDYMGTLGPADLIITEKDDGIMLANLYPYMGGDAFSGKVMARLAPYRGTRILFNPYFPRNYSTQVFLATLREAKDRHLLDGADRIVFMRMAWSESPLTDLMLCDALDKQVITFPVFSPRVTRYDIERARAAIMLISKQALLADVLPVTGKARACLNGAHDMVPGFRHGTP
jgi:4-amino-4-deoxy-L-arabinose transferase-like glycosyltransferase